jgi:hypothetical protein
MSASVAKMGRCQWKFMLFSLLAIFGCHRNNTDQPMISSYGVHTIDQTTKGLKDVFSGDVVIRYPNPLKAPNPGSLQIYCLIDADLQNPQQVMAATIFTNSAGVSLLAVRHHTVVAAAFPAKTGSGGAIVSHYSLPDIESTPNVTPSDPEITLDILALLNACKKLDLNTVPHNVFAPL